MKLSRYVFARTMAGAMIDFAHQNSAHRGETFYCVEWDKLGKRHQSKPMEI